ncbi:MAG: hypothetical protein K0U78_13920 [Actinomycetia bacterium]|nr:hypothetical protein [Actinomycetes bacterium]
MMQAIKSGALGMALLLDERTPALAKPATDSDVRRALFAGMDSSAHAIRRKLPAGAIVRGDVPRGSVAGGVPARLSRTTL